MIKSVVASSLLVLSVAIIAAEPQAKTEHVMFGGTNARNMVNLRDKCSMVCPLAVEVDGKVEREADAKVKWKVELGSRAYGGPIIAGGKVLVGTNNETPRNKRDIKNDKPVDLGVLMCFEEATGKFLWQAVHDKLPSGQVNDWPQEGICSTPVVEGNRVYYVSNRCTVVCADLNGFADGNQGITTEKYKTETDADIIWEFDMMKELGVFPHNMAAGSPMIVGETLFLVTANGVDEGHINIPSPGAPSFLALDKTTGKVIWHRNDPGKKIMHGQWSNPVYAEIKGTKQVIFPGGDGRLYALTPDKGEPLWNFDCNPKDSRYELGGTGTKSDFIGTPVVHDGKIYIGVGQDPEHFTGIGHFYCIDPAGKTGDLSPELVDRVEKDAEGKEKTIGKANPNSAMVWHYGGTDDRKHVPRNFHFGRTMSTAAIVDDVIYISELTGQLHCLDLKTGKCFWQYDTKSAVWGSPYYCDGKIYLGGESYQLFVFKHEKNPKSIDHLTFPDAKTPKEFNAKKNAKMKEIEAMVLLGKCEFDAPIRSTPIIAGGVLYVMTEKSLTAFEPKAK